MWKKFEDVIDFELDCGPRPYTFAEAFRFISLAKFIDLVGDLFQTHNAV